MKHSLLSAQDMYQWEQLVIHLTNPENKFSETFRQELESLAIASSYALNQLCRNPQWLSSLDSLQHFDTEKTTLDKACENQSDITALKEILRQFRHKKLIEIIYLDVIKSCSLQQTLENLSNLADLFICTALQISETQLSCKHGIPIDQQGKPLKLNILAMGKLGGQELNFSSDIDLICCFANDGELSGYGRLSYQEYFARQVRLFSQLLNDQTENGFVYRVDLRLRPWGDSGPVALTHAALEHYYQLHGREWEQYAMVKARILNASESDHKSLSEILKPFVYRKYHDYRVFEGLAGLKDKIDLQAKTRGMQNNIKLGEGGIREIEFFVQAFQILKGGRNIQLQSTRLFHNMDILQQQLIVPKSTIDTLRQGYCFLRQFENKIQMLSDQQTHSVPENQQDRERLAFTLRYSKWDDLSTDLQNHRRKISECFTELFKRDVETSPAVSMSDSFDDESAQALQVEYLESIGLLQPLDIQHQLADFFRSKAWSYMSAKAKQRFNQLLPDLLKTVCHSDQQAELFKRLINLFRSIAGRSVYFELLHQQKALLKKLAHLFNKSDWIAQQVSSYPMLLEQLIAAGNLHERFDKSAVAARLALQLDNVSGDTELELDVLRLFKLEQTIVIATAELAEEIKTEEVGYYLTELAEVLLQAVFKLSETALQALYGKPKCSDSSVTREARFSIIGYGKLGGYELHYQSDLDVIFLHDSRGDSQHTDGKKCIDNSVYFGRLAQKIISTISVMTGSGKLYEIDSRLRPEGASGLLVSSTSAYLQYQIEKAWTWEHQALVRARHIAGNVNLENQFRDMRSDILTIKRDSGRLRGDISNMREKIHQNKKPAEGDLFNIKYSRGGIMDIEFLVQYWVLLNANNNASICLYSDNISLLNELYRLKLISSSQSQLVDIYSTYHRYLHETVLQNKSAEIEASLVAAEVAQVIQCWNECFSD